MDKDNIKEKYLPIGTVVMLKGGKKRVMISGFCGIQRKDENNKMWDYIGCIYPEGFLSSDQTLLFDHEQIEKIFYYGLEDEEDEKFKETLKGLVEETQSKKE